MRTSPRHCSLRVRVHDGRQVEREPVVEESRRQQRQAPQQPRLLQRPQQADPAPQRAEQPEPQGVQHSEQSAQQAQPPQASQDTQQPAQQSAPQSLLQRPRHEDHVSHMVPLARGADPHQRHREQIQKREEAKRKELEAQRKAELEKQRKLLEEQKRKEEEEEKKRQEFKILQRPAKKGPPEPAPVVKSVWAAPPQASAEQLARPLFPAPGSMTGVLPKAQPPRERERGHRRPGVRACAC